jgi:hypothetical protein
MQRHDQPITPLGYDWRAAPAGLAWEPAGVILGLQGIPDSDSVHCGGGGLTLAGVSVTASVTVPPPLPTPPAAAILTYDGADLLLQSDLGAIPYTGLVAHLYTNVVDLAKTTTVDDLDECVLPGYAEQTLDPSTWVKQDEPPDATYQYTLDPFVFDPYMGPSESVSGYYITDSAGDTLCWVENFPNPIPIPLLGSSLPLVLVWTDVGEE